MTITMHAASVPVFEQMLTSLGVVLAKAEAHATAKNIEPHAFLQARLYPDMFPLVQQVKIAAEFARGVSARLANVDVPTFDGNEASFADLQLLISQSIAFLDNLKAAQIDGSEAREIVLRPGTPKEKKFVGQTYLLNYAFPHFFFHVTTAYAILRHNGVEVGKRDYVGA
jgi:uncharacterized protein